MPNDRRRGALLGLAVGDALGAAVEFEPPGTFEPVTGYRSGGPHELAPGEWTDDTAMALALADSIADTGWNLEDQAARYLRWWRHGDYSSIGECFDIGTVTATALTSFERHGDARRSGQRLEHHSGNGSVMRLAPVSMAYCGLLESDIDRLALHLRESSLPTHASRQSLDACEYLGILLAGFMFGVDAEQVLDPDWAPVADRRGSWHPLIAVTSEGAYRHKRPPAVRGTGWVVESLEAALWALFGAADFEGAVLRAVNLGDDADTTGAVCGQLAGARWGVSGIPGPLLEGLARRQFIEDVADRLIAKYPCHPQGG